MALASNTPVAQQRMVLATGVLLACLEISGCGGGSGGSGSTTPTSLAINMSLQPTSVVQGQSATLTWSAPAGSSCTASGGWTGTQPASGSTTVKPTTTGSVNYTLKCNASGSAYAGGMSSGTKSITLSVTAPSAYTATALVSDVAGGAALTTDASLVNPWGIASGPTSPVWVANNHTETSTLYDGNGKAQPTSAPLVVSFAAGTGGATFDPTGVVFNATSNFVITSGAKSGAASFLFAGEGGMIAGWDPSVDPTHAITTYTDAGGAVYKGLAIANSSSGDVLYATDFHNGKVVVFDRNFKRQTPSATSFSFTDSTLPAGYAPFGIAAVPTGAGGATQIYVSYAQQSPPDNHDNLNGAGLGLVDVYDVNGNLVSHLLAAGGHLNAPWGLALAPKDFGTLSDTLLIGNFGDGRINGYDPKTGVFVGSLVDSAGTAFAKPGLWGLSFGNDSDNQPHNTLFYAAGLNNESNGEYGRIDLGAAPVLNAPPVVAVTAPTGSVSGTVTVTAAVKDSIAIAKVEFFAAKTSLGVVTGPPYSVQWDTTQTADGTVTLKATATDVDGNVGTSPTVNVTVANNIAAPITLSQIQASVFTPICSTCHNGSNPPSGALPGSQNLTTAGNSFTSLVNVASHEQPALLRVKPGDPANSYIIQKLQGAATISGARMPLGGPYLDQATIDQIASWIASGAPNN